MRRWGTTSLEFGEMSEVVPLLMLKTWHGGVRLLDCRLQMDGLYNIELEYP